MRSSSRRGSRAAAHPLDLHKGQLSVVCLLEPQTMQRLLFFHCSFSSGRSFPLGLRRLEMSGFLSLEVEADGVEVQDDGFNWLEDALEVEAVMDVVTICR